MFQRNHQACQNYRYALTLPKVLLLMGQLNARHILDWSSDYCSEGCHRLYNGSLTQVPQPLIYKWALQSVYSLLRRLWRDTVHICCCGAVAADCWAPTTADRYLLPVGHPAANPMHATATADRWDRQTDKRTPDRYTDHAQNTTQTVPIKLM